VLVRQTIRAVSANHGFRVSFSPAVNPSGVGNGGHLHTSVWRHGRNLMSGGDGPRGLTDEGASFIAGMLEELPALLAIGAPSVASYLRLRPSQWAAPFQSWGLENRESGLRLITGSRSAGGAAANIEAKVFDLTANPYLVVGGVLAAGLDGVRRGAELPPEVTVDPAGLSPEALADLGASPLPSTLEQAVERFEGSALLNRELGDELARSLVAVRRDEIALFANSTPHQIAVATRWRH
jgi:glutamine synthetase